MSDSSVPCFPEDLITDILVRLPVKSIGRFRCVSKSWQSLLSSPWFIKDHLTFHMLCDPRKLIFIDTSDRSPVILTFTTENNGVSKKLFCPFLPQNKWANVEGSCHGLVLVINAERSIFLWNPVTSEAVKIPTFGLSLDPSISFAMHGFGYDESSDDYKIVTLSYYDTDNEHEPDCAETFVDIYSVKMKTWKRLPASPYDHAVPDVAHGVFVNGCLHWLASDNSTKGYLSVIAAFNLGNEKFEKVSPPRDVDESKFVFYELIVLGRCLALIVDSYDSVIDVWVMKEYGVQESWTKFTINYPADGNACSFKLVCPLSEDEMVLVKDCEKLVVYNLSTGVWRDMEIADELEVSGDGIMTFAESLLSPNFK